MPRWPVDTSISAEVEQANDLVRQVELEKRALAIELEQVRAELRSVKAAAKTALTLLKPYF
jgi:hypothetical protein